MSSLREVKDRIASVKSTLKITSAMKLVASSKLRRAQRAIDALRPYERALGEILRCAQNQNNRIDCAQNQNDGKEIVVAIAGNTSLCGGFNAAIIKKALEAVKTAGPDAEVWSLGRKMAEAMKKEGYPSPEDCTSMISRPTYNAASALASSFLTRYAAGEISRVTIVYSHFVSSTKQTQVCERLLPLENTLAQDIVEMHAGTYEAAEDYILEPGAKAIAERLLPQVISMRLYAAILDSAAAEQAARTVAMQTASDNAKDMIAELTLEYNKGRQQKITAEILDLVGGAQK